MGCIQSKAVDPGNFSKIIEKSRRSIGCHSEIHELAGAGKWEDKNDQTLHFLAGLER
jgi:hypothetical protein